MTPARARIGRRPAALTGLLALALAAAIPVAPGPASGQAGTAIAIGSGRVWWDARSPATKTTGALRAVAARSATDAWAVGWGSSGIDLTYGIAHHWNGTTWQSVATPAADTSVQLTGVDILPSGDAVAVGNTTSGGRTAPRIEQYPSGGGAGQEIPGPVPVTGGTWQGIDLLSATDGWAVGLSGSLAGDEPAQTLIARWDGTKWQQVPSPNPGTLSSRLTAVTALAADDAWAVGQFRDATNPQIEKSLVLHWNGLSWSQVASPNPGAVRTTLLAAAAAGPGEFWAVGYTLDTATNDPAPDQLHAVALYRSGGGWKVLRSAQATVTEFTGVVAVGPRDVVLAGYQFAFGAENITIEEWKGAALTPDLINPGETGGDHIASALGGVAAEPNGGRLWAVGWAANASPLAEQPYSLRSDR